ncbi:MAG: hypothetical protein ACUVT7_08810 [Thermoplasmata archaeon]
MDLEQLALLILAIVLVALAFYVSGGIVGRDWTVNGTYLLRILVVSLTAVVVIPVFRDAARSFELGDLGLLFAFVILVIVVLFILVEEMTVSDEWLASIVVSLIAVVLIYVVDAIGRWAFDVKLLPIL